MQTILALIFTYLVFVTRTWPLTRLVVLVDFVLAVVYDFTPLRVYLGVAETAALVCTMALWIVNLAVDRGTASPPSGGRR